jgi:protein-tyrosine phosphatase
MANSAVSKGITRIVATPHHLNGYFDNPKDKVLQNVVQYNMYLKDEGIPLVIYPGQELRIHREILKFLETEILTIGNKGKYLLLEMPSGEVPSYSRDIVYELMLREIRPILVHPERNRHFQEEPSLIFDLLEEGVLVQLTAGSVLGHFGRRVKLFSERIIKHKMVHLIASDAHNINTRGFLLTEAYEAITQKHGIEYTFYLKENTELVLNGQSILAEEVVPFRKRIFGYY